MRSSWLSSELLYIQYFQFRLIHKFGNEDECLHYFKEFDGE